MQELLADPNSPWHEYRGRGPITKNQVAALLRDYDIRPVVLHPTKRADFSRHGYMCAIRGRVRALLAPRAEHPNTQERARRDVMFGCLPLDGPQTAFLRLGFRVASMTAGLSIA